MKFFLLISFSLTLSKSNGQSVIDSSILENLERSRLYMLAQAHNNKANTILEQELLLALNKKYNVRFDILEYAHSAAFLINQYLQTGQDTILSFINPEANFKFIRSIKAHNDTVSNERKIWFYGLDFENRHEGKYTRKAVAMILEQSKITDGLLHSILRDIATLSTKDLRVTLEKLSNYLSTNEEESRLMLGRYYIDLLLIANAQFDFTPKRDEAMISNFKRLYKEIERTGEMPAFFSSFGTGHVNPNNSQGIAMRLLHDKSSPVKYTVSLFGIQYYNCRFNKEGAYRAIEGSLNFLCKRDLIQNLTAGQSETSSISFLTKEDLSKLNCKKAIDHFTGLFIVRNFEASLFWTWE